MSASANTDSSTRYAPHPHAAWRDVEGHIFIITPDSRQHELDGPVEHLLWSRCTESPRTLAELLAIITESFDVATPAAERDLSVFIQQCVSAGVLLAIP